MPRLDNIMTPAHVSWWWFQRAVVHRCNFCSRHLMEPVSRAEILQQQPSFNNRHRLQHDCMQCYTANHNTLGFPVVISISRICFDLISLALSQGRIQDTASGKRWLPLCFAYQRLFVSHTHTDTAGTTTISSFFWTTCTLKKWGCVRLT